MNVTELLRRSALRHPERAALIAGLACGREVLSFGALVRRVEDMTSQLRAKNLHPGDRVLLAVPLSIDTYVALIAALETGLVVMFVDPGHGFRAVSRALRAYPPAAVIAPRRFFTAARLLPELRLVSRWICVPPAKSVGNHAHPGTAIEPRNYSDSALLTFTSGSTGHPKAVIRTHGFLQEQLFMLQQLAVEPGRGIELVTMPMFVLCNLANGISSILPVCDVKHPSQINAGLLVAQLMQEEASSILAAPALLDSLLSYLSSHGRMLPFLRHAASGGGPVPLDLPGRIRAVAPNCELRVVYGSTEAEPISTLSGSEIDAEDQRRVIVGGGLLVGNVVAGCDLRIIADKWGEPLADLRPEQFDRLQMPVGRVGEIVVSGKHVLQSYLNIGDNRAAKFSVGKSLWHRTGDSGYLDETGRLWLTGRCSAALRDSSGVVYPFELELPLAAAAGVRKAALLDDAGVRLLVLELEPNRKSIADLASHPLVRQARIDHIAVVSRIPMDKRHNSKVDYVALEHLLDGKCLRYRALCASFFTEVGKAAAKLVAQLRLVLNRCP